ncbi:MAG: phospho-N-acetylmuramoyl-pentapeptide-transferase [Chloroflexota bacterium]|nr:phospho-N-acetylmuramoyl-pentapeptide-transferase [Chloroflexota bacterium]
MMPSALAALALAFGVTLLLGGPAVARLRRMQLTEQIRDVGLEHHAGKRGTPTMGGLLVVAVVLALTLALDWRWPELWPLVVALIGFGLLGAADDLAKVFNRLGYGFQVRYKFIWHPGLSLIVALLLFLLLGQHTVDAGPIHGIDLGWAYVALAALAIFSASASSLVDGLDGLAGGVYAICFAAYFAIAVHNQQPALAMFSAIAAGALAGFLWFNVNPARVFMGDTGALAFAGALGAVAVMSRQVFLLPLIGLVLVVDVLSVMLQVGYFKLTHGKRLFLISPYHHHLERKGWAEVTIVQRFWLVTAITAALGVGLAYL